MPTTSGRFAVVTDLLIITLKYNQMQNSNSNVQPTSKSGNAANLTVGGSTVSVMIRIIDLYPATPWRTAFEVRTEAYIENVAVKHKWNKRVKRKAWKDASIICDKWKEQMSKEGVHFWQQ